jgi:predicted Zn-dependent protease
MFAYTRDQEREADAISIRLMDGAGYDTSEAAAVWGNLLAEVAARPGADASKSSVLFATHPASDERRDTLKSLARPGGEKGEQPWRERLAVWQVDFLEDELKRGQWEETLALLGRKIERQPQRADLHYARGEAHRLRAQGDDLDQAVRELADAAAMDGAPPQTFRSLGLVRRARADNAGAAASFTRYLELAPDAPDAGLIKSFLSELNS